jgi:hypothetical protein
MKGVAYFGLPFLRHGTSQIRDCSYICKKKKIWKILATMTIAFSSVCVLRPQRNSKPGRKSKSLTTSRKTVSNTQADEYEIHPYGYGGYGYGRSAKPR